MVKEKATKTTKEKATAKKALARKDPKGVLDKGLAKIVSRKLLVWATATAALVMGVVPADDWLQVCLLYIGSQAAVDVVTAYRHSGSAYSPSTRF